MNQPSQSPNRQSSDYRVIGVAVALLSMVGCGAPQSLRPPVPTAKPVGRVDQKKDASKNATGIRVQVEVMGTDIPTPAGIAVQPGTGDVFVSSLAGVLRFTKSDDYCKLVAISGFSEDSYGRGPRYRFGPLGLGFADRETLIVGGGGMRDGEESVRIFHVGEQPQQLSVADATHKFLAVVPPGARRGEGNFFGMLVTPQTTYVTSHGDDTKGWISQLNWIEDDAKLQPWLPTKAETSVDGPAGITLDPAGKLLVSQTGELDERFDSIMLRIDPVTKKVESTVELGLHDVLSLVHHPHLGLLAIDFSWADPAAGGLFSVNLVDGEQGPIAETKKLRSLLRPTAMCVDARGDIWVTQLGAVAKDQAQDAIGELLRIRVERTTD